MLIPSTRSSDTHYNNKVDSVKKNNDYPQIIDPTVYTIYQETKFEV